ncbi:S-layer homology domain-containing protein [Pleurocapsa sp. PCC 7319]|uniref:S-layer homology domain-containing protein n=1 Tax=Pleurocapsa sp. PCC 7319 TaxID=118161 RepID=UPI00034DC6F2|nr:S-layer homology domain-containing protein [Pleurocapsa sp. PCC 7319]
MFLKQNNQKALLGVLVTSLFTLLASCGNSAAIESLVSADPKLKANTGENKSKTIKATESQQVIERDDDTSTPEERQDNKNDLEVDTKIRSIDLPEDFPASFPLYPKAKLTKVKPGKTQKSGMLTWKAQDNRQAIADYYQAELIANDWDITQPFQLKTNQKTAKAVARKNQLQVDLTLLSSVDQPNTSELTVNYQPINQSSEEPEEELEISSAENFAGESSDTESNALQNTQPSSNPIEQLEESEPKSQSQLPTEAEDTDILSKDYLDPLTTDFIDLDEVPEQLTQPVKEIAELGILTPYTSNGNIDLNKFAPNEVITRGEYARWLIAANNRYYDDNPGKKIYIATKTSQPAFQDLKVNSPDFGAIQGLAEAGLVPSRLTEDSTNLLFRPDAPLKREDLITWKVPLDMRQALPKASIEAIEESWGFQDATEIASMGIRALYADFQNGDRSNVRRIFGYTTLFQPKKPVTRAEAAASLWYFGFQGDGITAGEILESETTSESDS